MYKMQWAEIKGFTRHYYGVGAKDKVAIGTKDMSVDEVFEGLFFSKCIIIPFYFYGIIRHFSDTLHKEGITTRSELLKQIEHSLINETWYVDFKSQMKQHYIDAINNKREFGFSMLDDPQEFFGEFAVAHHTYIKNSIHTFLKKQFPQYSDLIEYDQMSLWTGTAETLVTNNYTFSDTRQASHDDYCRELYVTGRFDDRWMKKNIRRIEC